MMTAQKEAAHGGTEVRDAKTKRGGAYKRALALFTALLAAELSIMVRQIKTGPKDD